MDHRPRPRFLAKLALASASLLVALLAAELAFRVVSREKVGLHGMYTDDPVSGVGLTPGFQGSMRTAEFEYRVEVNDLGMRDGAVAEKAEGSRRALVIGDSFVFGVGVALEESLPKALERQLNEDLEPRAGGDTVAWQVFNSGVPGYSPFQELHTLRRLAGEVRPDLVVQVFFVGDDWYGNQQRVAPSEQRATFGGWVKRHSSLFRAFDRFVLSRLKGRENYVMHLRQPDEQFAQRRDQVLELLEDTRRTAAEHGSPLLVVLCPRYTQVYDDAWSKAALVYRLSADDYDPAEPNRAFSELLEARDFWALDLLGPLREEGRDRLLHFPIDGHWNAAGNEFVADLVAAQIEAREAPCPPSEGLP